MVHLCRKCSQYVHGQAKDAVSEEQDADSAICFVCLGLWQGEDAEERFIELLCEAVQEASKPYGGVELNRFITNKSIANMNEHPRIVLPGDLVHRFKLAVAAISDGDVGKPATPISIFADRLKKYAAQCLTQCLERIPQKPLSEMQADYPEVVLQEEQGFLGVNIVMTLDKDLPRPFDLIPPSEHSLNSSRRSRRQRQQLDVSQGGDPRVNHEERLEKEYETRVWTVNQAVTTSHQSSRHDATIIQATLPSSTSTTLQQQQAFTVHVAIWRKPFCLGANYTKSRRDVSQTPFFVSDDSSSSDAKCEEPQQDEAVIEAAGTVDDNTRKKRRLGITSVEEQILPAMERQVGGLSTQNEQYVPLQNGKRFGMIKFHASGREDMNVRMMLPSNVEPGKTICGRPFVCEVTDALRMPTRSDLDEIVQSINHTTTSSEDDSTMPQATDCKNDPSRSYGCNPLGVDISSDLSYVHASAYSNLQAETEDKIKHYACYCWSQEPFASIESLRKKLSQESFPLEIQQKTPIRVLHRRVNMTRIRHVLSCRAERTDDHHFILHISTDAGTYVKEWCHGDLGRTAPSLSTLLGCKTDILELDCEGIELY